MVKIILKVGGVLVFREGVLIYKGGTVEKELLVDEDRLSRLDLLWTINDMGFELCGPLYYEDKDSGNFKEIKSDLDLCHYLSSIGSGEKGLIFVDSPCDDPDFWIRVKEEELEAHKSRANINRVDGMCIKRLPKVETVSTPFVLSVQPYTVGKVTYEGDDVGETIRVSREKSDGSGQNQGVEAVVDVEEELLDEDDGEESDFGMSDGSYDVGLDDAEGTDDDATAEFAAVRETRTQRRLESLRKKKEERSKKSIKLGPVGVDKGLEKYINEGNHYAGLLAGDEEYIGSSDVDSFASDEDSDEIGEHNRKRRIRVHYDPNCKEPLWELGMVFRSVYQFREALSYYAVMRGVQLYFEQNDRKKVRARCSYKDKDDNQCPWLLYASLETCSGDFRIKTYKPVHECVKQTKNTMCNADFIAKHLKEDILHNPNIKLWRIQEKLKDRFKVHCTKSICRRAKRKVIGEMLGDFKDEFKRLFDYRDCILETNSGSTCIVDCQVTGDPRRFIFKGFYVCFGAMKKGFKKGCRKLIGFDGCFLKGVVKGQLLSAVAKNGNNQIYPLAWAIVHTENNESWSWFMEQVRNDLNLRLGEGLTVMTDMQKGLENAVQDLLPEAEHRECARHILANWAKKWRGVERRQAFWRCAKSTFERQLRNNLIELSNLGGEALVQDLLRYNVERWSRVYFKTDSKCDSVDNNLCETFNSWIIAARHKSIITMLEEIRVKVMTRHAQMIEFTKTWITDISPMAFKVIVDNTQTSLNCHVDWNRDDEYQVAHGKYCHVVNLRNMKCSCRAWALKGIPCPHAISAMQTQGYDPLNYVDSWYHKDVYLQAYSDFIQPMPNLNMIPEGKNPPIEPPESKPMPGRPKKSRKKAEGELKKWGKLSKSGIQVTCSYCKKPNHNKSTCKVRKSDQEQGIDKVNVKASKGSKSKTETNKQSNKRTSTSKLKAAPKKRKVQPSIPQTQTGYGVYVNERTRFTCMQGGRPENNVVIRTSTTKLQSSTEVTGDLGFQPKTRKWKGKEVLTQCDLLSTGAKKQAETRQKARQQRESLTQPPPPTEAQKQRSAANRERALKLLAARASIKASRSQSVVGISSSQPNLIRHWKY